MEEGMTRVRLLGLMREGRASLEGLVSQVGGVRTDQPSSLERWSLKDIVAHISAWERYMIAWLEGDARGELPELPGPDMVEVDVDRFNARVYAEWRNEPFEAVLAEFDASFATLLERVEAIPEGALLDPERFSWAGGKPLWHHVAATSYRHYAKHLDQIREAAGGR
jgi:hypothetical protein